ncbi:MAG: rod shape-determining protein MreC [Oscillospiraceae bacterium]|nr:rod shape-determining protein MreC [Oscillospiraceae bacterium]
MRDFFKSWKFKVIVCIFALLVGFLSYALIYGGASSIPEILLKSIVHPFSSAANSVSAWVEGRIDALVNADKYKAENEQLKIQLSQMLRQIKDVDDLQKENEQLKKIIDIKEDNEDFKIAPPGNIILRNAADVFKGFTIDRGTADGIKIGDPVVSDIGLIGVVRNVTPAFSEVMTILSTEVNIGVMSLSGSVVGIIENTLSVAADQKCLMSYIEMNSDIKVGDIMITSGGSVYPPGIIVGEVVEIFTDDNGLSLNAVIEPAVNLSALTEGFVIISFKGQGAVLE